MKNYYYCNANGSVYTENEKTNSRFPASRFEMIGQFKSRVQAETAFSAKNPFDYVSDAKRI